MARYSTSQADNPFGDPMNRPGPAIGEINPFSEEADAALKRGASFFSDGLNVMGQVAGSKAAADAR
ncbi:hypothetical protein, partial [Salmonella enterica]|uniref:hypothetical protein n=1 Tax=Salmonella enterica TaxID=28901 RepID=UPI003D2DD0D5